MALSPLLEFVDTWDKTPLSGNETELTLLAIGAVLGLCLGIAWLVTRLITLILTCLKLLSPELTPVAQSSAHEADYLLLLFSPPSSLTSLRI